MSQSHFEECEEWQGLQDKESWHLNRNENKLDAKLEMEEVTYEFLRIVKCFSIK